MAVYTHEQFSYEGMMGIKGNTIHPKLDLKIGNLDFEKKYNCEMSVCLSKSEYFQKPKSVPVSEKSVCD